MGNIQDKINLKNDQYWSVILHYDQISIIKYIKIALEISIFVKYYYSTDRMNYSLIINSQYLDIYDIYG